MKELKGVPLEHCAYNGNPHELVRDRFARCLISAYFRERRWHPPVARDSNLMGTIWTHQVNHYGMDHARAHRRVALGFFRCDQPTNWKQVWHPRIEHTSGGATL
jgi:hypothetical protein